jgi:transcriptional regulator with XRE-family HTH domain
MPPRAEPQVALGRAVRRLREERGLTQEAVAHVAGVHATWVSRLECGNLNPSWGMVERVATALGMEVSDLAKAAEGPKKGR